jgi:hypothetical protein
LLPDSALEGIPSSASPEPAARLRRLAAALGTGEPVHPDDAAWVARALHRYLEHAPDGLGLEAALGLSTPAGGEPWWRTERRAARDDLLRRLAAMLPGNTSGRAQQLQQLLRRYAGTGWRLDSHNGAPSPRSPERELLFRLFTLDPKPPTSLRRLIDIIS